MIENSTPQAWLQTCLDALHALLAEIEKEKVKVKAELETIR